MIGREPRQKQIPLPPILPFTRNLSFFFFSVPFFFFSSALMQDTNRISKIHRRSNRHDNLMDIFVRHLTVETQLLNACRHKQAKHGIYNLYYHSHGVTHQVIFRFFCSGTHSRAQRHQSRHCSGSTLTHTFAYCLFTERRPSRSNQHSTDID